MWVSFEELVPKMEITNDRWQDLVVRVSHNKSDFSEDTPILIGESRTFYRIYRIEFVNIKGEKDMEPDYKHQEELVREWNEKYPAGTQVIVTMDDKREVRTETVHAATMLGGHTAVAWLKDYGCYLLERVRAIKGE